jgi:hypothetical protein
MAKGQVPSSVRPFARHNICVARANLRRFDEGLCAELGLRDRPDCGATPAVNAAVTIRPRDFHDPGENKSQFR